MSRFFTLALACALSVVASSARATVLSSYLTFDGPTHITVPVSPGGGEDFLQDDSVSKFVDVNGGGFGAGDAVWGALTLSDIDASGKPSVPVVGPNQIAILFSVRVGPPVAPGIFTNTPIGNALDPNGVDLRQLLAGSDAATHINDNTVAVIMSTSNAAATDPLNLTTANFTSQFSNPANGWKWELTADLLPGTDDFFHFQGDIQGGTDVAALTITSSAFLPAGGWLPVDVLDFGGGVHLGSLTLDRGRVDPALADQVTNGWTFRDTSDLFVNPVPEPGSMAIFGLLGAAGFLRARRNKK